MSQGQSLFEKQYVRLLQDLLMERYDHPPLAFVHSYGCQQNVSDGEKLKGQLALVGYGFTDSPASADLILFNTCAVRETAQQRVYGNVGALKQYKRQNPNLIIGLCGCMMQQPEVAERIRQSYPYVDLVLGTFAGHKLAELLYEKLCHGGRVFDTQPGDGVVEDVPVRRDGIVKAWLPIMYGCDNFCTYCIVPYVRGRERSRSPQRILAEAKDLVAQGYKDITLLGQNVNSYGKGLEEQVDFAALLRLLNQIDGDFRIRFMTSHPKDCTRALIDAMADSPKVCNHLHLPVQSGSDKVLADMNRGYTVGQYRELVDYAKARIPGLALTSDIIVGFPTETESDFAQTLHLIEEVGYSALFTFLFSPRTGTQAASLEDSTPPEEKSRRFQTLLRLQQDMGQKVYQQYVGTTFRILAEGEGKTGQGYLTGRNEQNIIVEVKAPLSLVGQWVDVRITKAMNWALCGELTESFYGAGASQT